MKQRVIVVGILILAGIVGWHFRGVVRDLVFESRRVSLPPAVPYKDDESLRAKRAKRAERSNPVNIKNVHLQEDKKETKAVVTLPITVNLAVPFTSQAPHGVWDAAHEQTCEESSVLMADAFFAERGLGGADAVERELQKMIAWERGRFGYFEDTTAEETAVMARELFGYKKVEVVYEVTADDIKHRLAEGVPVILPLYGRVLGNPFYTAPGPDYHMLVVRGYTADGAFITNDPGTRHGEAYLYRSDILVNAIHDWNGGDVVHGRRAMIVMYPN